MKLALAGDTMLGRSVGDILRRDPQASLFSSALVSAIEEADLFLLNLECCISTRGALWPDPNKPFFFRAPPAAAEALAGLGVDCVTLANNHALDYGCEALVDTLEHLDRVGIAAVGAGRTEAEAHRPALLTAAGVRLAVIGVTDYPAAYAAGPDRPGVAHADLRVGLPAWLAGTIGRCAADVVCVTPHWGPNMAAAPLPSTRAAAAALVDAGAALVAGHSAHVFQGVEPPTLYDLGDFVDDYRTDSHLRNDLGLLFIVSVGCRGPEALEALPLKLSYCRTGLATGEEAEWVRRRFAAACRAFGTDVGQRDGRLTVRLAEPVRTPPRSSTDRAELRP